MRRRTALVAAALGGGLLAGGGRLAVADNNDGLVLTGQFRNGGTATLELEDRNVSPLICFLLDNPAPDDGDGIHSSIRARRTGATVIDLGSGDQWIKGEAVGCAIPPDLGLARSVFRHPRGYALQFDIVENQGTAVQAGPLRTGPLRAG